MTMYKDRHENLTSALLEANQEIEEIDKEIKVHKKNMKKQMGKVFLIMEMLNILAKCIIFSLTFVMYIKDVQSTCKIEIFVFILIY